MELAGESQVKKLQVTPVVLCGGSGTRLWPLSRKGFPKQFLCLTGKKSLFQQAVERGSNIMSEDIALNETFIVTGEEHRFIVLDQLRDISNLNTRILLEPEAKNTAPALTLAALEALKNGDDPVLIVTPADQKIIRPQIFNDAIQRSIKVATSGAIVILGVKPTAPETGFGYIRENGSLGDYGEVDVAEFIEKPDQKTASTFYDNKKYSWNAGMFVVRASVWLDALKTFRDDILNATKKAFDHPKIDQLFFRPDDVLFKMIPSESIDYAVLENCPGSDFKIKMVSLEAGWSDLGSWDAVWQTGDKDSGNNLIHGDALLENSSDNLIYSSNRLVGAVGVKNLVIVETADAVLVSDRNQSQDVKSIVSQLANQKREEHAIHRKVSRPWGWYDTIDVGDRFKVKRIQVNPGASLSLQKHQKRAEHWVVVKGTAEVICGEKLITLKENESTYIPLGEKHRLTNPSGDILEIIEVQSGSYLGEDDIIRIDDGYGRN